MFSNFKRCFNPTPEDTEKEDKYIDALYNDEIEFWISQGLNQDEIDILFEIESIEFPQYRGCQTWVPRRQLLENGIITIEDVKKDIGK